MTVMSSFALMLPSLAITTRRLHDIGMSGWWQLVGFVPMIGLFVLALLLARRGSPEPNPYGEPDWLTPTTTEDESLTEPEVVFYDENR